MEEVAFPYLDGPELRCISNVQNPGYRRKNGDCVKNYLDDDFFEAALKPPGTLQKTMIFT